MSNIIDCWMKYGINDMFYIINERKLTSPWTKLETQVVKVYRSEDLLRMGLFETHDILFKGRLDAR